MGSLEVRNLLLSKKLKLSETRLLIIDDNQIRYNEIVELFQSKNHLVHATLLDELKSFEKQLNTSWDLVIFGQAYDIKIEQAVTLIQASAEIDIPVLLLKPNDYQNDQYLSYIQKGIYEVINLEYTERFYVSLIRALSYSRTLQAQKHLLTDLENAKNQAQALAVEQHKAVALIQEGIHTEANEEYLKLFGLNDVADIIGLPLLDILQPKNINDFKQRFKKVSQGQFDLARFEIDTLNANAQSENPLKIEFLPSDEEDAIQITIETNSYATNSSELSKNRVSFIANSFQQIHYALINQPAKSNALVLFSFSDCPKEIFNSNWDTALQYLENFKHFVKEQTNSTVYQIDNILYGVLLQAESDTILESRIQGLHALEKSQLLEINSKTYPFNLKIGYTNIYPNDFTEQNFSHLLEQAYNHRLVKKDSVSDLQLSATLEETKIELTTEKPKLELEVNQPIQFEAAPAKPITETQLNPTFQESPILTQIAHSLEKGEIQLKYQQLYDKQDSILNIYEVSCGFIFENQWKKISNLIELDDDVELSIKLDRWILVEACKQLHNFITQYPEAKLVVNLNRHVLFNDKQFPELISKLLTIVGSRLAYPLILQFDEEDIAKNIIESQKQFAILKENGAEISIRRFGSTFSSETILKQIDVGLLTLDEKFTDKLNNDAAITEFQHLLEKYHEIKPVDMVLKNLNDMNLFANAWNVEVRYLQGEYFQKKLDHLTDVQDH
ncbi:EAL domain-containing protein [Acinetobacter sp. P8-3-8]|uniref:EAL domain-containing protein n=1 Tax=Acinetobacter sp. P8-3-8 TaxID=1029823 RepID=UPI0002487E2A|nr:EAL domain-containing protein [Acinetobacter sp. P8-3-8]